MSQILHEKNCYFISLKLGFDLFSVVLDEIVRVQLVLSEIILTSLFAGVALFFQNLRSAMRLCFLIYLVMPVIKKELLFFAPLKAHLKGFFHVSTTISSSLQ